VPPVQPRLLTPLWDLTSCAMRRISSVGTDGMPVTLDTELPMMTTGPLPWC